MTQVVRACVGALVVLAAAGSGQHLQAAGTTDQRVLIWGGITDREQQSPEMARIERNRDQICSALETVASHPEVNDAMVKAEFALNGILAQYGLPPGVQNDVRRDFADGWDDLCDEDLTPAELPTSTDVFIIYSHCSMLMTQTDGPWLALWLQGDMNEAIMVVSDGVEGPRGIAINRDMSRVRRPVAGERELIGAGRTTSASFNLVAGPRPFELGVPPNIRTYDASHYSFDYTSSLSGGMMGDAVGQAGAASGGMTQFPSLAAMTRVKTSGSVWISSDVPGTEIVHAFYNNYASIIEGQQGAMSFLGGMLRNQEVMTSKGIPLEYESTVSAAMGMRGTSTFKATDVMVISARATECVAALPPGTEMIDLGGPSGGPGSTPGIPGSGIPGLPGAGSPGAGGTGNSAGPASATSAESAAGPRRRSNVSCADDLYSDNITLMVQRMLDNLGYEVGGLDGKLGVQTMIAISEFEAEKGRQVTGEASPLLAGILSAEVDKRCPR